MPRKAPARRSAVADTTTKKETETGTRTRGRRSTTTENVNKTAEVKTESEIPTPKSPIVENVDDTPIRRSGRQRKANTRFAEDEKEESVLGTEVATPPKDKEKTTPKKKSLDSKSDLEIEPLSSPSTDKQIKEEKTATPKRNKKSKEDNKSDASPLLDEKDEKESTTPKNKRKSKVDNDSDTSPLLDEKDKGESATPKKKKKSKEDNESKANSIVNEKEKEEESTPSKRKKKSNADNNSEASPLLDEKDKGEGSTALAEKVQSSLPESEDATNTALTEKVLESVSEAVDATNTALTEEMPSISEAEEDKSKSQTDATVDMEIIGALTTLPEYQMAVKEAVITTENDLSSALQPEVDNKKTDTDVPKDKEETGKQVLLTTEDELSAMSRADIDNTKTQTDIGNSQSEMDDRKSKKDIVNNLPQLDMDKNIQAQSNIDNSKIQSDVVDKNSTPKEDSRMSETKDNDNISDNEMNYRNSTPKEDARMSETEVDDKISVNEMDNKKSTPKEVDGMSKREVDDIISDNGMDNRKSTQEEDDGMSETEVDDNISDNEVDNLKSTSEEDDGMWETEVDESISDNEMDNRKSAPNEDDGKSETEVDDKISHTEMDNRKSLSVVDNKSQTEVDSRNIEMGDDHRKSPKVDKNKSQVEVKSRNYEMVVDIRKTSSIDNIPQTELNNRNSEMEVDNIRSPSNLQSEVNINSVMEEVCRKSPRIDDKRSQTEVKNKNSRIETDDKNSPIINDNESLTEGDNKNSGMEVNNKLSPGIDENKSPTVVNSRNSEKEVDINKSQADCTTLSMDWENTDENVISIENEVSSLSRSEADKSKIQVEVSRQKKNLGNQDDDVDEENEGGVDFCHFYNRGPNGCNTTAEDCNWLHLCSTCCEEHPVKTCKMQKEKENLKKKLFRRGRRGGRNSCEKRDSDVCYYFNRNLNGCKVENCKLSHECFCCGESHPIIACEYVEIKNAYKSKCYHFNRGMLGCREKKCEKLHSCFICSKVHSIISCDQKENIRSITAMNDKSVMGKPAVAFGVPFNLLGTDESHKNDGPLCYAFNEGPNGCSEPEGTCKAVHACYTCGENHPVKSCKQSPIKSTAKITKQKARANPKQNLEKLAKAIEEKKKIAKQKEEIRVLEEIKEMDEIKELCVLRLEEKIKLTKANTTKPKTNFSNATHKKTNTLSSSNAKINTADTKSNSSIKENSIQAKKILSSGKTTSGDKNLITTKKASLASLNIESTNSGSKHKPISPPPKSKDTRISKKRCSYFNSSGCRNSTSCPWFHGCSYCNGNHPLDTCRKPRNPKVDFCSYFNRGPNGCRNIDRCPFVHACYLCGGGHSGSQCSDKTVTAAAKASKAPEQREREQVKSQKIANVKRLSSSSNPEQYRSRYSSGEHRDSLIEQSEMYPPRLMDVEMSDQSAVTEHRDYARYRSRTEQHYDELSELQDYQRKDVLQSAYRSRSRDREPSIEYVGQRENLRVHRSRSGERNISLEREHLRVRRSRSKEREHLKVHRSNSRERQVHMERENRHRSRSRDREQRHMRVLVREQRSRSRERYRSHSQERIMANVDQRMEHEPRRYKTGRAAVSPLRERRSRSRERISGGSSTSDFDHLLRLQKESSRRKSVEDHKGRELAKPSHSSSNKSSSSSRGLISSKSESSSSSSFDAVEACIILSNFCSDLGLLGPTLEEMCKRALSNKSNILAFFRDPEVRETMEFVSQKLIKLKSSSSNILHKEKYGMGLAKIRHLMKESTNKHF